MPVCFQAGILVLVLVALMVSESIIVALVWCSGFSEELVGLVQELSRLTSDSDEREASDLDIVLTLVDSLPV